jgi:hypothetical protein
MMEEHFEQVFWELAMLRDLVWQSVEKISIQIGPPAQSRAHTQDIQGHELMV